MLNKSKAVVEPSAYGLFSVPSASDQITVSFDDARAQGKTFTFSLVRSNLPPQEFDIKIVPSGKITLEDSSAIPETGFSMPRDEPIKFMLEEFPDTAEAISHVLRIKRKDGENFASEVEGEDGIITLPLIWYEPLTEEYVDNLFGSNMHQSIVLSKSGNSWEPFPFSSV